MLLEFCRDSFSTYFFLRFNSITASLLIWWARSLSLYLYLFNNFCPSAISEFRGSRLSVIYSYIFVSYLFFERACVTNFRFNLITGSSEIFWKMYYESLPISSISFFVKNCLMFTISSALSTLLLMASMLSAISIILFISAAYLFFNLFFSFLTIFSACLYSSFMIAS